MSEGDIKMPIRLQRLLDKITHALFGETNLRMQAHQVPRDRGAADFSCGRSESFRVKWSPDHVVIKPRNKWYSFAGFFPYYRFKGTYRRDNGSVELSGRVVTVPFVKIYILIWMSGVLIAWIAAICIAGYTMLELLITMQQEPDNSALRTPDVSTQHRLMIAGAIAGIGTLLIAFGAGIVGVHRMIYRRERRRLIEFCQRFAAGNLN